MRGEEQPQVAFAAGRFGRADHRIDEKKHGKSVEQLYKEREKRAKDATQVKVPDRVPLSLNADPANYTKIHRSAAYYDPIGWKSAVREVTVAFEPDMCNAGLPTPEPLLILSASLIVCGRAVRFRRIMNTRSKKWNS